MSKTILVAGKDMPGGIKVAEGLEASDRRVALSCGSNDSDSAADDVDSSSSIAGVEWNRASPVSARTFVLEAESSLEELDEALLYFDEDEYSKNAGLLNSEECLRTSDSMVLCYQYLTMTLLERFEKKHSAENPASLVFLLKNSYTCADLNRNPSLKNGMNVFASPVVAAAASSFEAFAENIAALYSEMDYVNIVLVKVDAEDAVSEKAVGQWIGEYNDSLYPSLKSAAKKSVQWLKPGSKISKTSVSAKSARGGLFGRRR